MLSCNQSGWSSIFSKNLQVRQAPLRATPVYEKSRWATVGTEWLSHANERLESLESTIVSIFKGKTHRVFKFVFCMQAARGQQQHRIYLVVPVISRAVPAAKLIWTAHCAGHNLEPCRYLRLICRPKWSAAALIYGSFLRQG
jgi:hypothetical protein